MKIGVIGAGTMGQGIAKAFAQVEGNTVEVEEKLFGACFETHDQQEGMACFLSREKPKPKAVFTNN